MDRKKKKEEMTIYEIVNDICNRKTNKLDEDIRWNDVNVSSFMLRRWVSMTSTSNAYIANSMFNRIGEDSSDSKLMYHAMSSFAMPYKGRKIQYLKKSKVDDKRSKEAAKTADDLGISEREAAEYDKYLKELEQ